MKPMQSLSHEASKTIAFRVSAEDYDRIQLLIDISGTVKQDYLLARALNQDFTVYPNSRIQKYLEKYLIEIYSELKRLNANDELSADIIKRLDILLSVIAQM